MIANDFAKIATELKRVEEEKALAVAGASECDKTVEDCRQRFDNVLAVDVPFTYSFGYLASEDDVA